MTKIRPVANYQLSKKISPSEGKKAAKRKIIQGHLIFVKVIFKIVEGKNLLWTIWAIRLTTHKKLPKL